MLARIIRPSARPLLISLGRGPDRKRIYLNDAPRFFIAKHGDDAPQLLQLLVDRRYGAKHIIMMTWMALLCGFIAFIASVLRNPLAMYVMILVGTLASLLMSIYVMSDLIHAWRMPKSLLGMDSSRDLWLYDDQTVVMRREVVGLRCRTAKTKSGKTVRDCHELDLLVDSEDGPVVYQLIGVKSDHDQYCQRLAARFATLAGLEVVDEFEPA